MNLSPQMLYLVEFGALLAHAAGVVHALHAIKYVRTPQGSIAWALALIMFPYLAVPAYWVLGRSKFYGYVAARRAGDLKINHIAQDLWRELADHRTEPGDPVTRLRQRAIEGLAQLPATRGNHVQLLVDGAATFDALLAAIDRAERYILVQFFIVHDDQIGRALRDRLVARAKEGVRVYFLYDEVGCYDLPMSYLEVLKAARCNVSAFNSTRGRRNRFQINFRNHRKVTVVDGEIAFIGGLNAGDEYLGRDPDFGRWRDTHLQLEGPAVDCCQLAFVEDWYWATRRVPELDWTPRPSRNGNQAVLIVPSGPADEVDTCELLFVELIHAARERLWICSPYFVPDAPVVAALQLAALRGVDVRILLPQKADHLLVYLSGFSFLDDMEKVGIKIHRYGDGFLHQKVLLADNDLAMVGTANLDNRSFRLNFEINAVINDAGFAADVRRMLDRDFAASRLAGTADLRSRPLWFRISVRVARLLAPMQ